MNPEDKLHQEIRIWMQENNFPAISLDEVELNLFNEEQLKQRNEFLKRFENLDKLIKLPKNGLPKQNSFHFCGLLMAYSFLNNIIHVDRESIALIRTIRSPDQRGGSEAPLWVWWIC